MYRKKLSLEDTISEFIKYRDIANACAKEHLLSASEIASR
jgi:hypothetical protein